MSNGLFCSLRARRDLLVQKQAFGNRVYWSIKEPITERFFQLRDEEYFLWCQFALQDDAQKPVDSHDLLEAFGRQFASHSLSERELIAYLRTLLSLGLLVDIRETGVGLLQRRDLAVRQARRAAWLNPLAIRWNGVNPTRLIEFLYPIVRLCFHPLALAIAAVITLSAVLLLLVHIEQIALRLPTLQAFFTLQNLFWLAVGTATAKVLHELAHALTCKHFGGECKELGVMLLVFTPCLYCDVSDAWLFQNKWQRIAVSAAGIVMELFLASVAAIAWWFSEPGLLNTLSFNIMLVCSIGTVLFNGNPLLKFDGYYVLADLVEVPNLKARATAIVEDNLSRLCLGTSSVNLRTLPDRGRIWLLVYGISASIYRVVIMATIVSVSYQVLKPLGLVSVAHLLAVTMIAGLCVGAVMSIRHFLRVARWSEMKLIRVLLSCTVIAGFAITFLFVPFPHYVVAPIVIEPQEATPVFVRISGRIPTQTDSVVRDGQLVKRGDVLLRLENAYLESDIAELKGSLEVLRTRNRSLETRRVRSETIAGNLASSKQLLASLEQNLSVKLAQQESLAVIAPRDGIIVAPEIVEPRNDDQTELLQWQGRPLDEVNRGCTLPSGVQVCSIAPSDRVAAIAVVEQSDIPFVQVNQRAKVWVRGCPGRYFEGCVGNISLAQFTSAPRTLMMSNTLPMIDDQSGGMKNAEVSFSVQIPLDSINDAIPIRGIGWAKIKTANATLASRLLHYLSKTFLSPR